MAGGLLNDQLHYAETQIIADPVGNGECEEEGDSTSNEDDTNESTYRETYQEFFLRHMQNMIHFLVEDWFISAMLGFITAILSISVDLSYEYLNHYKVIVYDQAMKVDRIVGFSAWVMYIVAFVGGGAIVCKYISRHAIGSGIPEVKVIMNGFMLQNYLTFRTLVAKVAGLVLTLGSGLPVGKEGPFVHMGAIVATLLAKATRPFQHNAFYSNEGRDVEILSSGCAVGIACTFSAPAGAVLYGIESTHKYFAVKSYWRSFFATTCSALLFRFANYAIIPKDIAGSITAYYQTSFPNEVFVVEEIPIFAMIGILSGLLGAAFLILHKRISKFIRRNRIFLKVFGKDGFAFTIFMAFVVGVITFPDGVGSYVHGRYNFRETLSDLISNCTMTLYNTSISRGCDQEMVFRWTADAAATTPNVMPTLVGYFSVMLRLALSDIYVRGAVPNKESSCGSVQRLNDFHIDQPEIIKGNKSYYNGTLSVPKDNDGFSGISINIHPPIQEEDDNGEEINHEETLLLNDVTHVDEETDGEEKSGEK
uniref:Chloride channel protein n=1 Tax=Bursaphelenchus xylophilus TaxID=6326 RepID=A0A1I7SRT3_BURXY